MRKILLTIFTLLIGFASYAAENLLISDIKVEGLQRVEPGLVFSNIPFEINDSIDEVNVSETISFYIEPANLETFPLNKRVVKLLLSLMKSLLFQN